MNEGLKRLRDNIEKLIDVGYSDDVVGYMISYSSDVSDLNSRIEDELSYAK